MKRGFIWLLLISIAGQAGLFAATPRETKGPPLLKPEILKKIDQDREIYVRAKLENGKVYTYSSSMRVNAGLHRTRDILTDYRIYSKVVPYIDQADYEAQSHVLHLKGGIFKFYLQSWIHFEERGDRWIHFRVIRGHFTGMEGNIYFEPHPEKGTRVYFEGGLEADHWPPQWVIERGAEVVFSYTAHQMRKQIEEKQK